MFGAICCDSCPTRKSETRYNMYIEKLNTLLRKKRLGFVFRFGPKFCTQKTLFLHWKALPNKNLFNGAPKKICRKSSRWPEESVEFQVLVGDAGSDSRWPPNQIFGRKTSGENTPSVVFCWWRERFALDEVDREIYWEPPPELRRWFIELGFVYRNLRSIQTMTLIPHFFWGVGEFGVQQCWPLRLVPRIHHDYNKL